MKATLQVITLLSLIIGLSITSSAQRTRSAAPSKPAPNQNVLTALPPADVVALVKVQPLLNEALPKMLAQNPAKLAEVNTEIDKLKTRTGLDARACEEMAFGMRYNYPREGVTKFDSVAIARGTYKTESFVAAGKNAGPGKYREEKYQDRTLYIFTLEQQVKVFGIFNLNVVDLAVAPLDARTLALGGVAEVKRAIDASKGQLGANAELIALATRDPNAIIGFGGNVTPALVQSLKLDNEIVAKDISSIKQVYGSVGTTEKDVALFLAARTTSPASAQDLSQTLTDLSHLGAFVVSRMPAPKGTVARAALDNLKITTQGSELQIRT